LDKLQLRGFEFAKAVTLVVEPFSVENGLLTPTMKVNLITLSLTPCFVHLPMGKVIFLSTYHPSVMVCWWAVGSLWAQFVMQLSYLVLCRGLHYFFNTLLGF